MFRHKRGLTAGGALHRNHRLWCQIQGGGKSRSGATSIDDNAVDDAIAGEADKRSPPAVSPYTHLRVATLLQMWSSAYHGDAMLHGAFSQLNTLTSRFAALEAVPAKGRRATKWRKGSYFSTESYLESVSACCDAAGLLCWKPVRFSIFLLPCWNPKKASLSGRFLC